MLWKQSDFRFHRFLTKAAGDIGCSLSHMHHLRSGYSDEVVGGKW